MSRVLTANDICARALRAIGAFPVTDSAPDGEQLREAMYWLDLLMAETVGVGQMFSRYTDTLDLPITNGTGSYDFFTSLGSELPTDRIQYIENAWCEDGNGNRWPIEVTTREKFEDVSRSDESGRPVWLHIDRTASPTLRIFPTPATTDTTEYTLKLVCQMYAPNVAPAGVTGTQPSGSVLHDLGQAWQRWLVLRLSLDLGSGPITKLPESSLARFERMAAQAEQALEASENREHETSDPLCEPWGMIA